MRLSRLVLPPLPGTSEPGTVEAEWDGDTLTVLYNPDRIEPLATDSSTAALEPALWGWDEVDGSGQPKPINADGIEALAAQMRAAVAEAITGA